MPGSREHLSRKLLMECLVFESILRYFYHVLAVEAAC